MFRDAHFDLNTFADMSDLPDEQSRAEARAAIEPEPRTADIEGEISGRSCGQGRSVQSGY